MKIVDRKGFVLLDDDGRPVARYDDGSPIVFPTHDAAFDWQIEHYNETGFNIETTAFWNKLVLDKDEPLENPNVSDPKATPWNRFEGQVVALAYNLAVCGPNKDSRPGEACWTVRSVGERGGRYTVSQTAILGYCASALLVDCTFVINEGLLKRKRAAGKKDVFAFVVGTAVSLNTRGLPSGWYPIGFSPMKPPKGRGEDQFQLVSPHDVNQRQPIDSLAFFFGDGRKALGAPVGRRNNPGVVTVGDLRERMVDVPDLTE